MQADEFRFGKFGGSEYGDAGEGAADHRDLVAGVETGAGLAVFVDLVGQGGALDDAEAEVEEEVGDAGEEADTGYGLLLSFGEEGAEEAAASALALGFGLDYDGADFGEMWAVEMQGAAAQEDAAFGFGDGEVADVLADLGVVAAEEGTVAREGVDELEDVDGVLQACLADLRSADAGARGGGGGGVAEGCGKKGGHGSVFRYPPGGGVFYG